MPRRKRRKAKVWVLKMDGVQPVPRPSVDDVALDLVLGAHEIVGTAPPHALIPVGEDRSFRADMTVAWQAHALDVDVGHWASVKKQEVFSTLKLPRRSELIRKELIDLGIHAMAELAWALEEGEPGARQPSQEQQQTALEDEPVAGQPRQGRLQTTLEDEQEEERQLNHTESLTLEESEPEEQRSSQGESQDAGNDKAEKGQLGQGNPEAALAVLYELVATYRSIACLFALHQFRDGFALCQHFIDQLEALTEADCMPFARQPETECEASGQGAEREPSEPSCIKAEQAPPKASVLETECKTPEPSCRCIEREALNAPGQEAEHKAAEPAGQGAEREVSEPLCREAKNEPSESPDQWPHFELDPRLAELRRFLDSCNGQVSAAPFPFSKDTRPEVDGRTLRGRRRKQREQGASTKGKTKGRARHSATVADTAAPSSTSARTKAIGTGGGRSARGARSNDRDSDTGSAHGKAKVSATSRARGTVRDSGAASEPPTASAAPTHGTGTEAQTNPREAATTTTYLDKPLEALVCSALLPYLALIWCRCFERVHYESLEAHQWWELAADGTLTTTTPASFSSGYTALKEAVAAEADRVMQASGTGLPYPDPLYAMPLFPKSPTKPAHLADVISVSEQAKRLAQLFDLQITWPAG